MIDLHTHTTASDGSTTPSEIVRLALEKNLSAIAITDHDTVSGYKEAAAAAEGKNIEVIPGIEFGSKYYSSIHILGLYIDTDNETLNKALNDIVDDRDSRNAAVVELMCKDGIEITYADMKKRFGEVIGRPHFAQVLIDNNLAGSTLEAFQLYLNKGKKYWLPRTTLSPEKCIELVLNAGGIPILAHPFEYRVDPDILTEITYYCFEHGLKGIEVLHPSHSSSRCNALNRIADRYNIFKTGGSDYHGLDIKPNNDIGMMSVPDEWLIPLKDQI